MLLLPKNLANLATFASRTAERYAMSAIHLTEKDNGYRAEATDGKSLAVVIGTMEYPAADYPEIAEIKSATNGRMDSLIPSKEWNQAFKIVPKVKKNDPKQILKSLVVVMGEDRTTFAATDLGQSRSMVALHVDGRFPPTDQIISKRTPKVSIKVDAVRLAEMLKVAAEFSGGEINDVILEVFESNRPLQVKAKNEHQEFTGLVMPLS